ncbi:MAG: SpoVR family protein [Myxococcales bacterium]|nr:SpoVR family protein [Myxococcales bacterium]USN51980.1 MAG: SpoVR family protein [Myxococcales bacterium]
MPKALPSDLREMQKHVDKCAKDYGLDCFDIIYEMLDYDEINMVAAYMGFPVRYPHWKWGMEYERLKKSSEYGLNKIYEMVINNDPCYAYLLESNTNVDQKLVMCHVTGHNDFFKNNFSFSHTNRSMINEMANHAANVRRYMNWYGVSEVESFIDRVLSLENLIDVNSPYIVRKRPVKKDENTPPGIAGTIKRIPNEHEYMERYINPESFIEQQRIKLKEEEEKAAARFPKEPAKDVLAFIMENAPLKKWQADVVAMVREEAYYFAPQAMTKIMNEGWASYWHAKLMSEKMMEPSELIDFADRHSGVMATTPTSLNPYKLGLELYRDIEERWNKGRFGSEWDNCSDMSQKQTWDKNLALGQEKIFQVRKIYNDLTFIDEFLTLDFCKRAKIFTYGFDKRKQDFVIESREFSAIKQKLLNSLTNMGHPQIQVINGNYENRSELLLEHVFASVELDLNYARETLKNLASLWSRPVHILTKFEGRETILSHDGENFKDNVVGRQI